MQKKRSRNVDGTLRQQSAFGGRFGRHTVFFSSLKCRQRIRCPSQLEAQYCLWLEHEKAVLEYTAAPFVAQIKTATKTQKYTPDFLVEYGTGERLLVDLMAKTPTASVRQLDKLNAVSDWCRENGYHHTVVEADAIQRSPFMDNLGLLYGRGFLASQQQIGYLHSLLSGRQDSFTARDLLTQSPSPSMNAIARAVFYRELIADLDKPFTLDRPLSVGRR